MTLNFALREEPINQVSPPVISTHQKSILDWLEQQGRFMNDEPQSSFEKAAEELEDKLDSDTFVDVSDYLQDEDLAFDMDES